MDVQLTTTILLVRHGQTKANVGGFYIGWSNEDLNESGYTQARRLSERLTTFTIASIYTSPLRRAYTTAAILAESHKLELILLDDLAEIRLGDWQGLQMNEIKRRWPELWEQSMTDPSELTLPNGESYIRVTERAVRALKTAVETNQGKQVVIVTHEVIIKVLIAHVLGISNRIYRRIRVDNGSLSIIRNGENLQLVRLNDTSHLEG